MAKAVASVDLMRSRAGVAKAAARVVAAALRAPAVRRVRCTVDHAVVPKVRCVALVADAADLKVRCVARAAGAAALKVRCVARAADAAVPAGTIGCDLSHLLSVD